METAWAEGSSTMTGSLPGNAEVDLVATPERRLRSGWCVFVAFVRLVSCGRRVASSVCFFVQLVWFLDPVFLINWVNSFLSIRAVVTRCGLGKSLGCVPRVD